MVREMRANGKDEKGWAFSNNIRGGDTVVTITMIRVLLAQSADGVNTCGA
jgi:hypothetical protein